MIQKIKDLLYRGVHASGRLFYLSVELGGFTTALWVGREEPDAVRFKVDVELMYGTLGPLMLAASVGVGIITIEFSVMRDS
ncbi:hypothetical protein LCGC14_2061730 [marine sediment metagenome]|uniref:Uncharacterized protein n=1 Tax=marine sediment metagenome TaxID=412755 RepID=A0A0F9F8F8_9ZZZZ